MTDGGAAVRAEWAGDVLDRKLIADFLYQFLISKHRAASKSSEPGSMTFALDAQWGLGKTFFVSRWAKDIEGCGHPVIVFDAWKSDLAEEPLLSFIATFRDALRAWTNELPVGHKVKKGLKRSVDDFTRKAGRAVVPAFSLLAKGAIRKLVGTGIDELAEVFDQQGNTPSDEQVSSSAKTVVDDAMDKFFSMSLDGHSKRLTAVETLKGAVCDLLSQLQSRASANLPMFVFIDELDRCRPNYAIELLEGVKHLFDVPGICFCISTNIAQLSESIKGVYGGGFDSRMYLKRFFAFEYRLPEPQNRAFAEVLAANSVFLQRKTLISGLSDWASTKEPTPATVAKVFAFVASSFQLSLRSQQQVFAVAEAACTGIHEQRAVHLFYLFSLAALLHVDSENFDNLIAKNLTPAELSPALEKKTQKNSAHSFTVVVHSDRAFHGERRERTVRLVDLLKQYLDLAERDAKEVRKEFYDGTTQDYPGSLRQALAEEAPSVYNLIDRHELSIRHYSTLVRTAGYLIRPD
jgi:KAP family P-loop domain